MPRYLLYIVLFSLGLCTTSRAAQTDRLHLYFFGSATCGECLEIKEAILKPLQREFSDKLLLHLHDLEDTTSFALMTRLEKTFKVVKPSPQELFFPDTVILGYASIMSVADTMIRSYLADPQRWKTIEFSADTAEFAQTLRQRFDQFSFWGITAAGLVDGVNPCAIATLIFLISFLATRKRKRGETMLIGLAFTASVYVTYVLLGIGAFQALTMLDNYRWLSQLIRWSAIAAAALVGLLSFWDAARYSRTHKTSDITLQLPKAIKLQIHKVITANLKGSQLVWGAIVTGFLVTLLEAVCTGQVYLPTIVLMTKSQELRLQGWLYLLYYNVLFVLPLLIVIILAYQGMTWNTLAKATQHNMVLLKVLLGIVMVGLAVFLFFSV